MPVCSLRSPGSSDVPARVWALGRGASLAWGLHPQRVLCQPSRAQVSLGLAQLGGKEPGNREPQTARSHTRTHALLARSRVLPGQTRPRALGGGSGSLMPPSEPGDRAILSWAHPGTGVYKRRGLPPVSAWPQPGTAAVRNGSWAHGNSGGFDFPSFGLGEEWRDRVMGLP